jgi:hypothetical protein
MFKSTLINKADRFSAAVQTVDQPAGWRRYRGRRIFNPELQGLFNRNKGRCATGYNGLPIAGTVVESLIPTGSQATLLF